MIKYLLCFILLIATTTLAQTPIPRVGHSCPTGTYRSGDYCKPIKSSSGDSQAVITKSGSESRKQSFQIQEKIDINHRDIVKVIRQKSILMGEFNMGGAGWNLVQAM